MRAVTAPIIVPEIDDMIPFEVRLLAASKALNAAADAARESCERLADALRDIGPLD